jgi:hypothetical protein
MRLTFSVLILTYSLLSSYRLDVITRIFLYMLTQIGISSSSSVLLFRFILLYFMCELVRILHLTVNL